MPPDPPASRPPDGTEEPPGLFWAGYAWAAGGVAGATLLFWLARGYLDKAHASLLYLPIVVACATRYGFGPAVLGAAGSFACWNYFFLPPYGTWVVEDPKDWLALFVFLAVALATARLAARGRDQAREARAREREARALQRASEQISGEVEAERVLPALARQLVAACAADFCAIYRRTAPEGTLIPAALAGKSGDEAGKSDHWLALAQSAHAQGHSLGFSSSPVDPALAVGDGVFAPLIADGQGWGVVHVGPRRDGCPFGLPQERLIGALANHAAIALARQALSDEAAQARALRESDSLKSALLSLVSHELRTPLAAIKASASGLLQPDTRWDAAALREALQAINDESDRLAELVSKLLDLSRLEAGAWRPDLDWCDLVDVLGIALARLPPHDGTRVRVAAPPDLPLVRADFVQMAQVMTNLLENALKYAPLESDVIVTLCAEGATLRVDVADAGPGIPPGEAEAVFDRFHRLERHRRAGPSGTGLGLAICRGIVEAHGGHIWERNAPGGGAVFTFTLPLALSEGGEEGDDDGPAHPRG